MDSNEHKRQLVKIMADSTTRRFSIIMLVVTIGFVLLTYIIAAFAIPNVFIQIADSYKCPSDIDTNKGFCTMFTFSENNTWVSHIQNLTNYNVFFLIGGNFLRNDHSLSDLTFTFNYTGQIIPVDAIGNYLYLKEDPHIITTTQKVQVYCQEDMLYCNDVVFMMYPQVQYEFYKVKITLDIDKSYFNIVQDIAFFATTQDPEYTTYQMALRYVLLTLSLISFSVYLFTFLRIKQVDRTFEHKWILILSVSLLLFNDPIYGITILKSSIVSAIFSTVFVTQFICLLVFFWSIMMVRIHKEPVETNTNLINYKTVVPSLVLFVLLSIACSVGSVYSRFDPGFKTNFTYPVSYDVFISFATLLAFALIFFFFYNTYYICKNFSKVIPRHKFFFNLSFYFIMLIFLIIITGFYQSYDSDGIKLLVMFIMCNFYIIVLQILWRPSLFYQQENSNSIQQQVQQKNQLGLNYFEDYEIEVQRKDGTVIVSTEHVRSDQSLIGNQNQTGNSILNTNRVLQQNQKKEANQINDGFIDGQQQQLTQGTNVNKTEDFISNK